MRTICPSPSSARLFLALWPFLLSFACSSQQKDAAFGQMLSTLLSHSVPEIHTEDLRELPDSTILLDAREKEEFRVSHLRAARWIGYDTFSKKRLKGIPKDAKIVVYCSVGCRSEKIAEKLRAMGYADVSNLYGGIFDWVNKGRAVYDQNEKPTRRVHAFDGNWGLWLRKGEKVF